MSLPTTARKGLTAAAAIGALALGGSAIAGAADNGTSTTTTPSAATSSPQRPDPSKGGHQANGKTETLLSGDTAAKVKAAALAKVPGTVERVETNVDGSAPYETHIKKADGTEVEVQVSSDYTVAAVNTMGPR